MDLRDRYPMTWGTFAGFPCSCTSLPSPQLWAHFLHLPYREAAGSTGLSPRVPSPRVPQAGPRCPSHGAAPRADPHRCPKARGRSCEQPGGSSEAEQQPGHNRPLLGASPRSKETVLQRNGAMKGLAYL